MSTLKSNIIRKKRKKKYRLNRTPALQGNPQRKAICVKAYTRSPKKPNSAKRAVCRIRFWAMKRKKLHVLEAYIPGEKHNVQDYSVVLMRGGRIRDLPGIKYRIVRGALDCAGVKNRKNARSKFGAKKQETSSKF